MSNIHLLLSLAGFITAIFAWFRFDINKRIDDLNASMNRRFDDVNNRFDNMNVTMNQRFSEMNTAMHKRIDDLIAAPKQAA